MKKMIVFTFLFIAVLPVVKAQKGDFLIGGSFDLSAMFSDESRSYAGEHLYNTNRSQLNFKPTAGYFLTDDLVIGLFFLTDYQRNGGQKQWMYAVGPMTRFYFGNGPIKPYIYGELGVAYPRFKYEDAQGTLEKFTGAIYGIDAGVSVFINKYLSIDAMAGYTGASFKFAEDSRYKVKRKGVAVNAGFSIHL